MSDTALASIDPAVAAANARAVSELLARYSNGFSVDAAGILTPRDGVRIRDAKQLMDLSRQPKVLKIAISGQEVEIEVRVLCDKEIDNINRLIPSPTPPIKTKTEAGKKVPDGYDRSDPKFVADLEKVWNLRRAASIAMGIPSLQVQGNTPEEQAAWLQENFATNLLETLYAGVRALSTDALERASFL